MLALNGHVSGVPVSARWHSFTMEPTQSDAESLSADEESTARLEADIRSAALVLERAVADDGDRTDLDDVIGALGFDRSQLQAELDAEVDAESL
jgi:hypothetical protein